MSNQQSNTWRNQQISTYKNLQPDSLRLQLTHICPSSLIIHQNLWFPQTLHGREEHEPAAEAEGSGEGLERPGHPSPLCSPQGLLRLWGAASYDQLHQLHLPALPCLFRRAPTEIGEVDYVFYSILQTTLYLQHVLYYNYMEHKGSMQSPRQATADHCHTGRFLYYACKTASYHTWNLCAQQSLWRPLVVGFASSNSAPVVV